MAFYVYAWRDVRKVKDDSANPSGVKDAPRVESTVRKFIVEKGSDPLAADLLTPLKTTFPSKAHTDATWWTATATAAAASSAAASRANDAVTVDGFRHGKSFLQFGIGYHVSDVTAAEAAINWKDL